MLRNDKYSLSMFQHKSSLVDVFTFYTNIEGTWGSVVVKALLLVGRSRDRIPVASVAGTFLGATDRTMCPGVDSTSKNEYQGFLLG
jgi:hypothetical protein